MAVPRAPPAAPQPRPHPHPHIHLTRQRQPAIHRIIMDDDPLKPYWADGPPTIVPLTIQPHFDALSAREKLYAHHLSK